MDYGVIQEEKVKSALRYPDLITLMENKIEISRSSAAEIPRIDKIILNHQRYLQIHKNYEISESLKSVLNTIKSSQLWIAFTEDWCDDSGLTLPYLVKMTDVNSLIQIKFLLRSENQDIMDHYLTEGNQAIPKVIAFDKNGRELFRWGPRSHSAQMVFEKFLQNSLDKKIAKEKLYNWMAEDWGRSIENEFREILESLLK